MSEDLKHIERVAGLIIKYHREKISSSEYRELMEWCEQSETNRRLFERLLDPNYVRDKIKELPDIQSLKESGWEKVMAEIGWEDQAAYTPVVPVRRATWQRYMIAASIATVVIGGWLYIKYQSVAKTNTSPSIASHLKNDVAPGGDKAILTLSDGSTVVLDSTGNGTIAHQGATNIVKVDNGRLAYNALNEKPGEVTYNTLTTPAAGQFQVALPDGSKVWLNNASSLRYPVAFTGKDREVELKGEAYFEIAHNPAMPFKVKVGEKMLVNVLGTSFNIAAYGDESQVKTTLLTGAVRVSEGAANALLKPGEQVQVNEEGAISAPKEVDADGVIAWKNGLFHFERADVRTVMRMLARWYDVEVVYEGPVTSRLFGGDIQRNLNLSQVLEILQRNQVHFSLEGRRITVRN